MSHLNYFEPYQSRPNHHEDQLTRAFLVVLRYSPSAMMRFYSYCAGDTFMRAKQEHLDIELPHLHQVLFHDIEMYTQRSSYEFNAAKILSVLITDQSLNLTPLQESIQISDRRAVYDGIIQIGSDLTLLIENKPNARNVWRDQLNPSLLNMSEENENVIIPVPAILEWRQIIQQLIDLLEMEAVSGMEKMLIVDFLDFVDRRFMALNPYERFSKCKHDKILLTRRIQNILETKFSDNKPGYHKGWAYYVMAGTEGFPEIKQIGVRLEHNDQDKEDWKIEISLYFGDIMKQARSLYMRKDLNLEYLQFLRDKGWTTLTNPHISMQSKNWYFFNSPENHNIETYIQYWQNNNSAELIQYSKADLRDTMLKKWADLGLIQINETVHLNFIDKLRNVQETTMFNWCPGFRILYFIPANKAIRLDDEGLFDNYLREKFNEGLKVLGDAYGTKF